MTYQRTDRNLLKSTLLKSTIAVLAFMSGSATACAGGYAETNLVTDDQAFLVASGYAPAAHVDANLVDPWGMDMTPGGAWYVANTVTGTVTSYNGTGAATGSPITIPQNGGGGPAGPTGLVYNPSSGFAVNGVASTFLVSNLDGSISGIDASTGVATQIIPGRTGGNIAVYAGLGIGTLSGQTYLYAPNQITGKMDVFNSSGANVSSSFSFTDPGPNPSGLVPYQVEPLDGHLFVSYAVDGPASANQLPGSGFVSEFNLDGSFDQRFATGGTLDSPWGMTIAPASWGKYGGDLLIGNFSYTAAFATIGAYDLTTGAFEGTVSDALGNPIELPGLWELDFGDGGIGGSAESLYFTAGIGDEMHGLLGTLTAVPGVPEPATWAMMLLGFGVVGAAMRKKVHPAMATLPDGHIG